jgi:exopolysaccharide biosynthesis polyprenyl glycosylphosphotransferase
MATYTPLPAIGVASRARGHHRSKRRWLALSGGLVLGDAAAIGAAFALAYLIRFKMGLPFLETPVHQLAFYSSVVFWSLPAWLCVFALFRLYDRHHLFAGFQEYTRVVNACTCGVVLTVVVSFLDPSLFISRGWLVIVWLLSMAIDGTVRFGARRVVRRLRAKGILVSRTVIVGANDEGQALAEQLISWPGSGAKVVGYVDSESRPWSHAGQGLPILGSVRNLAQIIDEEEIDEIVVAMSAMGRDELTDLYRSFGNTPNIEIRLSSGLFEILTTGVSVREIASVPLVTPQRVRIIGFDAMLKTALDYLGATLGLIALSPIFLTLALAVRLDSPGPIFHRRRVLGREGTTFAAFKFRTMVVNADEVLARDPELKAAFAMGYKLKTDPRITRVGAWLRRTSLDELPQLINVLRGEMSLVGPRMIAPDEAVRYGKWQMNLLTVKPGITGPWQVQGRSDIAYDERVKLSMNYIRNYSIWLDLEILLRTIPTVIQKRGAY